jgi:hypothetical protein
MKVPDILLTGNHAEIARWRQSGRSEDEKKPAGSFERMNFVFCTWCFDVFRRCAVPD